jgi:hypothetical protein
MLRMGRSVGRWPGTEQGFFCAKMRDEIQPRITRITRMKNLSAFLYAQVGHRPAKTNMILVDDI